MTRRRRKLHTLRLKLPWPPSVNQYWRAVAVGGRARNILSKKGREYREVVGASIKEQTEEHETTEERLRVNILASPPDRRRRDLDNILKPLLDGMEHAEVYKDDSQIDELRIARLDPSKGGSVVVVVVPKSDY